MVQLYTPFLTQAGAAIGRGLERRFAKEEQGQRNQLIQSAYMQQPGALEQLMSVDPQAAMKVKQQITQEEQQNIQSANKEKEDKLKYQKQLAENIEPVRKQLANFDSYDKAKAYFDQTLSQNKDLIDAAGVDPNKFALTPEGFNQLRTAYKSKEIGTKAFEPITLKNINTGEKMIASPTIDPNTGEAKLASFEVPAGYEISKETPEEKRAAEILASGLKKMQETRGKSDEERLQSKIDKAYEAADSIPVIQRSLDLLDMVDTGGADAAMISAKRLFGIESANEAELSYNLGKSVLSQLKATFGAAFTAAEGERLERLESNISKSPAGNKRILEQAKQIAMRAANRGIKAAKEKGDEETAAEIADAMSYRFSYEEESKKNKKSDQITIGGQTMIRPANMSDQDWEDYKKAIGAQ